MVRAGEVDHPAKWSHGGYQEIQQPPKRYRIIDTGNFLGSGYRVLAVTASTMVEG
jgi:hypothetical protein